MRGTHEQSPHAQRQERIIPAHAGNTLSISPGQRAAPDHPRACGEHLCKAGLGPEWCGSSPRMRGTPRIQDAPWPRRRIIPAHAGNTGQGNRNCLGLVDHPRACGEHTSSCQSKSFSGGSSPRMRGTRDGGRSRHVVLRIIPAHAGNTCLDRIEITSRPDHPRACGEHACWPREKLRCSGSSPRMRGTRCARILSPRHARIIPAHAGNTRPTSVKR